MPDWMVPTWAHEHLEDGAGPVQCPACRRRVSPDMLIDVRGIVVPTPWRPRGVEWICDACRERVAASNGGAAALYVALGAPSAVVAAITERTAGAP